MDPVTHFTSGIILSRSFKLKSSIKNVMLVGSVALLPDIDNLISFFGSKADYLLYHRGVTHSLWGGVLLGMLAGLLLKYTFKIKYISSAIIGIAIIYVHIYLDYITSYGTQLLAPFSNQRFSMSSVFIIDPFYTLLMLILLIFAFVLKSRKTAIAALAFVLVYPLTNLGIKSIAKYKASKLTSNNVIVTTTAFSPLYWKILVEDEDSYSVADINMFSSLTLDDFKNYKKFNKNTFPFKLDDKFLKTYFWFVDYPVIVGTNGNYNYEIFDLKFMLNGKIFDSNERKAFTLKIKTNGQGELKHYKFN